MNFKYFDSCMKGWKKKGCVSYDSLSLKWKKELYRIIKVKLKEKHK